MPHDSLDEYFTAIRAAEASAKDGLAVKCGIEVDFDPGTANQLKAILAEYPFDYVIGSVHFFDGFPIDECREIWESISEAERNNVIKGYWSSITKMARSGVADIAAHLDLYKKFGYTPTYDVSEDILNALDAIAEAGMSVEINTSGWHKPIREAYPSAMILKGCCKRGIPVVITADVHSTADLARDYTRAESVIKSVGYTQTATYAQRKVTLVAL